MDLLIPIVPIGRKDLLNSPADRKSVYSLNPKNVPYTVNGNHR
jgi:hypothetical protein